ncbi:LLM class flavin-dependent oxidoreductase [Reyranella sp. CPCC 100927]|uniref:LLM class flavin-dependent oxidoreductase n=1 Tax=Reyranella sp. CPCC 100927 TaxID=2599616 RepID=UPI0011B6DF87|nr:LLM class flavin-dependent oxidoreductase [Reyranella sp. CPCC 100927]TWS99445.1 LLM class flavin-dependent oxidoreductase [Reyranella sp. CPCC 100927]
MKTIFFHMQGYRDLPDDFATRYESIWITPPNSALCDPAAVARYMRWNVEELELADELGFDGLGVNEHHQNGYGFCNSPNLIASILARRSSDAAIVVLGNTLPLYNPPIRVAEEFAMIDCLSGGRLVAGFPVGSPPDSIGNYGVPPTQIRPRYYEAHDLIMQAWTRPGPFPFNGEFTKLRYVNPWPQPLQKPHPPVWLAGGGSVETWKFAADNNYTYSYLSFNGHQSAKGMMDGYWDQIDKAGLDDNPYRAGFAQLVVVGATDAEAERLYLKHIRNFYAKALHVPMHQAAVPGFMTKTSVEFALRQGAARGAYKNLIGDPRTASWKDFTETTRMVIGGSPSTVAQQLEAAIRNLRIGHLMVVMQIQSMDRELTEYSMRLFANHVLPRIRGIWDKEGYQDHWWPQGATRHRAPARTAAGVEMAR